MIANNTNTLTTEDTESKEKRHSNGRDAAE